MIAANHPGQIQVLAVTTRRLTCDSNSRLGENSMKTERAVLAGGCFWGMQDLIRRRDGVTSTRVGYTGGNVPNATYRNHGNHAEAIEIIFDPTKIGYRRCSSSFSRFTIRPREIVRGT